MFFTAVPEIIFLLLNHFYWLDGVTWHFRVISIPKKPQEAMLWSFEMKGSRLALFDPPRLSLDKKLGSPVPTIKDIK